MTAEEETEQCDKLMEHYRWRKENFKYELERWFEERSGRSGKPSG